jgi:hypothetical protein
MTRVALALVHHPVLDRSGQVVTTAITNLDLHDMARIARTYGATDLFVVHPVAAQRLLAQRIRDHWVSGSGRHRIPDRAIALDVVRVVCSLEEAYAALGGTEGRAGIDVYTTAASDRGAPVTSFAAARARMSAASHPVLIIFGTGWGIAPEVVSHADVRIEPIRAQVDTGYNHLSVRSACAIVMDRLLG